MNFQNYSMNNLAFNRFGHGTFSPELFLSSFFRWLISLPGLIFNAALLYTMFREKSLRGTCAILLAVGSACDFCFLFAFSIPFSIALFGQNVISNFRCYFVQFLPVIGLYTSVWIVFFVGFDRLFSVLFPLRYVFLEEKLLLYMAPMLTVSFGYSIVMAVTASQWTLFIYPDWPVICTHNDMFIFGMSSMLLKNGLIIHGASFFCYVFVAFALLRCWRKNPQSMAKHRIFKSLAAIMILVVGSYFTICAVRLLIAPIIDPFFLLHISPSISALLTYMHSSEHSEYRNAFRKQFGRWLSVGKWFNDGPAQAQQRQIADATNCNNLRNNGKNINIVQLSMTSVAQPLRMPTIQ